MLVDIYTDGSCKANPGPGACAAVAMVGNTIVKAYQEKSENTTNNREELKAILYALELADNNKEHSFTIYTDSSYCEKSFNEWIPKWASQNWKNSKNELVENLDLMKSLHYYCNKEFPNFQVKKIPGHSDIVGNELADAIATENINKIKKIFMRNKLSYMESLLA